MLVTTKKNKPVGILVQVMNFYLLMFKKIKFCIVGVNLKSCFISHECTNNFIKASPDDKVCFLETNLYEHKSNQIKILFNNLKYKRVKKIRKY